MALPPCSSTAKWWTERVQSLNSAPCSRAHCSNPMYRLLPMPHRPPPSLRSRPAPPDSPLPSRTEIGFLNGGTFAAQSRLEASPYRRVDVLGRRPLHFVQQQAFGQ